MKDPYAVVHTLLVTEKGTELSELLSKYTFKVDPGANKIDIRRSVEQLFDVKVSAVNVMNRKGKRKRLRRAQLGKRSDWKKAIVTLSEGSIEVL